MRKFARWLFWSYVVIQINGNDTDHLVELDGTKFTILIAGKWVKIFKKQRPKNKYLRAFVLMTMTKN